MTRPRAAGFALAASFSVYLIPLVGPHAAWFMGEMLLAGDPQRSRGWLALNWAVALAVQLLAFGIFWWFFRKPGWVRALPLLLVFPFVFSSMQRAFLATIPALFLEEPDVALEKVSWPEVCTAPGVFQTELKTSSELWVRDSSPENRYAVLTMPGCHLDAVALPQPKLTPGKGVDFMIDVTSVGPEGRAIVERHETRGGKDSWWLIPGVGGGLLPLDPPAGDTGRSRPILSKDGGWVAWLESIPNSGPPLLYRVFLEPHDSRQKEKIVDLSGLGPASYVVRSFDMESAEVTLWKTDRLVAVGFDGRLTKEFARPALARPQFTTYLASGKYWLAWDAYRDNGAYLVEWSLPFGAGSHRVRLGRSIHSAAFDASGRWIAVSVGTSLNIGRAKDAVYVLSSADGREVFRRYLPVYNRSPVAFLAGGFFAYSDVTGVRVLKAPE